MRRLTRLYSLLSLLFPAGLCAQAPDTLPSYKMLPAVVVPDCARWKVVELGVRRPHWNHAVSVTASAISSGWSSFVPNEAGARGWLESLSFFVAGYNKGERTETPIRIGFFQPADSGKAGLPLTNEEIRVVPGKEGRIRCDLSHYRIPVPAEGIIVTLAFFDDGADHRYRRTVKDFDGRQRVDTMYGFSIEAMPVTPATPYDPERPWASRPAYVPAVGLSVRVCRPD